MIFGGERSQAIRRTGMAITAKRYLTLFLLLVAASISYALGFIGGFCFFIVVGAIFELSFWVKLLFGNMRCH
jgi:hypothetical protein